MFSSIEVLPIQRVRHLAIDKQDLTLILIVIQTSQPFYGLTTDARSIPEEGTKDRALTRSIKFTPRISQRKQKPSLLQVVNRCSENCFWFPMRTRDVSSHRPQICGTGQALLEWDFFSANQTMKVETTKAPYGLEPVIQTPQQPDSQQSDRQCCLSLHVSHPESVERTSRYKLILKSSGWWTPERIFLLDTKPSSQDIEQDKRRPSFGIFIQETHSKVNLNRHRSRTVNWPDCELCKIGSNHRLTGPLPAFHPVFFLLMTSDTKDRQK